MSGNAASGQSEPERPLLRHGDSKDELSVHEDFATANSTLVQDILGIEFLIVVVEHVAGFVEGAGAVAEGV